MAAGWTTVAAVFDVTGVTVTEAQLARAQSMVDTKTGVYPDAVTERLKPRDRRRLERAVAWQAVWLRAQVEVEGRSDVKTHSQDGLSQTGSHEDWLLYAPLCRREIEGLSWFKDRDVPTGARAHRYPDIPAVEQAWLRDEVEIPGYPWRREGPTC